MSPTCAITYCDGLPGLGKTTAAIGLAAARDDVLLVGENNPLPADHARVNALPPQSAARWYLDTERRRSAYAARLAARSGRRVVCDKSVLATLAYLYAASMTGLHPPAVFPHARRLYQDQLRPHLPADAATVLFVGTVELSLNRRRIKPDRALRPVWFDPAFLRAQARFYTDQAPELAPRPPILLDAAGDHTRTITELAAVLGLPGPITRDTVLAPVPYPQLPTVFREVAEQAGHAVLGEAIGAPMRHLDSHAQAFERHLLHTTPTTAGATGTAAPDNATAAGATAAGRVWFQAQHWTPTNNVDQQRTAPS